MGQTRRRRAISRRRYRARGGMSESEFTNQLNKLKPILSEYDINKNAKTLENTMYTKFKKPIMTSIESRSKKDKEEISRVIDNFIRIWINHGNLTGVWNHLLELLFPGKQYKTYVNTGRNGL